jgi:hypothetical protein
VADEWRIEFYETPDGARPVERWLARLSPAERRAFAAAAAELLVPLGPGVCTTPWGRNLGAGMFELRIARGADSPESASPGRRAAPPRVLLRVFCHAHGDRLIILLGGYDKLRRPKRSEQRRQIALAQRRLADFRRRLR